jgi:nucleoside-diphosphate-sugar epimerase
MVFGPGSPNQAALQRLATLAFPLLPGEGHVRVQPIHVDDLAQALVSLAMGPAAGATPIPIGGATQLTMRELFAAIRRARGLAPREPVRLPLAPLRGFLTIVARLTASRFPVSAGQFVAFANDSTAGAAPVGVALPTPRLSLETMLAAGADA